MAKTGFWLRGAKGKLAGTTIYKGKTGTIQREIVSPSNPQSEGQMTQRSRFLSAVRFYQRSNQRFFKMAFEGKRQGESDFNAFMRLNAKLGPYITKAQGDAIGFPMIAPWILSQGSMAPVAQSMYTDSDLERDYLHVVINNSFSGVAPTTIGGVSAAFKASYPDITEGDIITIVDIGYTEPGNPFVDDLDAADISGSSLWTIQQFVINSNDARAISDVLSKTSCEIVDGTLVLSLAVGASDTVGGAACVLSRNTNSGLKVASASLVLNNMALTTYEAMRANSHLEQVLAWWGASKPAILQGSIANEQGGDVVPVVTKSFTFEGEETEQQGTAEGVVIPYFTPSMVLKGVVSSEGVDPLNVELTLDESSAVTRAASLVDTDYDLIDQIRVTRESDTSFKVTTAGFFEDSFVKFDITQWVVDGVVLV